MSSQQTPQSHSHKTQGEYRPELAALHVPLARKQGNRERQNLDIETIEDGNGRGEPGNKLLISGPAAAIKQRSNIHKVTVPKVCHGAAPVLEAKAAFYSSASPCVRSDG
jgi:hypothetical protein